MHMDPPVPTQPPFAPIGHRIKTLRQASFTSRDALAEILGVHVTSLAGWEAGRWLPRDGIRRKLAQALATDPKTLFAITGDAPTAPAASLIDTYTDLPDLLLHLTRRAKTLRALRLAAPYPTPAHVQAEWRSLVSARLHAGTLAVERVEIVYDLRRLREIVANILRYQGCAYTVKAFCFGTADIAPAIGGYFFDEDEFLLGAYWAGVPPRNQPGLRLSGEPFASFFRAYWEEIWRRGACLNHGGTHDLSAAEAIARTLGLPARQWRRFLAEAAALDIGDGAPPLV